LAKRRAEEAGIERFRRQGVLLERAARLVADVA
jgi:hypothetical protein